MVSLEKKQEIILAHEKQFAFRLSRHVLSKPELNCLMILIPFLLIFFIQDLMKYKDGLRTFAENYLLCRKKALLEAVNALTEKRRVDTYPLAEQAKLTGKSMERYAEFLAVLADHYTDLLSSEGDSFEEIVRSAYGNNRNNFLLFINQLSNVEKSLNSVLMSQLSQTQDGVDSTVQKMEVATNHLYRADADLIFGCSC
ncbi:MAG: NF038143 family protein [Proteobacteria bacterium]|nr:NF038143 family protein [Pseudomonadota bacterium]